MSGHILQWPVNHMKWRYWLSIAHKLSFYPHLSLPHLTLSSKGVLHHDSHRLHFLHSQSAESYSNHLFLTSMIFVSELLFYSIFDIYFIYSIYFVLHSTLHNNIFYHSFKKQDNMIILQTCLVRAHLFSEKNYCNFFKEKHKIRWYHALMCIYIKLEVIF